MRPFPNGMLLYSLLNLGQHNTEQQHTAIPLTFVHLLAIISLTSFAVVAPAGAAIWYYYGVLVYHSVFSFVRGWYL
jgi:hypothetical protein